MNANLGGCRIKQLFPFSPPSIYDGFGDLFAGEAGVSKKVDKLDVRSVRTFEAYPGCDSDTGVGAAVYLPELDLTSADVVLKLLLDIYLFRIRRAHCGTPCHS